MTTATAHHRPGAASRAADLGLGLVLAAAIAFTAFLFATSWGGTAWLPGSGVSVAVAVLALLRHRWQTLTAVAGPTVAAGAVAVSLIAGDRLPKEPAPATAMALAVLVGSAVRTLPAPAATGIAVGGIAVPGLALVEGPSPAAAWAAVCLCGALLTGPVLRRVDRARRARTSYEGVPYEGAPYAGTPYGPVGDTPSTGRNPARSPRRPS